MKNFFRKISGQEARQFKLEAAQGAVMINEEWLASRTEAAEQMNAYQLIAQLRTGLDVLPLDDKSRNAQKKSLDELETALKRHEELQAKMEKYAEEMPSLEKRAEQLATQKKERLEKLNAAKDKELDVLKKSREAVEQSYDKRIAAKKAEKEKDITQDVRAQLEKAGPAMDKRALTYIKLVIEHSEKEVARLEKASKYGGEQEKATQDLLKERERLEDFRKLAKHVRPCHALMESEAYGKEFIKRIVRKEKETRDEQLDKEVDKLGKEKVSALSKQDKDIRSAESRHDKAIASETSKFDSQIAANNRELTHLRSKVMQRQNEFDSIDDRLDNDREQVTKDLRSSLVTQQVMVAVGREKGKAEMRAILKGEVPLVIKDKGQTARVLGGGDVSNGLDVAEGSQVSVIKVNPKLVPSLEDFQEKASERQATTLREKAQAFGQAVQSAVNKVGAWLQAKFEKHVQTKLGYKQESIAERYGQEGYYAERLEAARQRNQETKESKSR